MAVGAIYLAVALSGIAIVGMAAWVMTRGQTATNGDAPYRLEVRVGLGHDADSIVAQPLKAHARARQLTSIATAKQGMAIEVVYRIEFQSDASAVELVKALNRTEGVQNVALARITPDE